MTRKLTAEVQNAHKARHAEVSQLGRELALLRERTRASTSSRGMPQVIPEDERMIPEDEEVDLLACDDGMTVAEQADELEVTLDRERFEKEQMRTENMTCAAELEKAKVALQTQKAAAEGAEREAIIAKQRLKSQREASDAAMLQMQQALAELRDKLSQADAQLEAKEAELQLLRRQGEPLLDQEREKMTTLTAKALKLEEERSWSDAPADSESGPIPPVGG